MYGKVWKEVKCNAVIKGLANCVKGAVGRESGKKRV